MDKTNMVGKRFGRLLVLAEVKSKHNRKRYLCQCDCGKKCIATGKTLREGKKKSCGCWFSSVFKNAAVDDSAACKFLMKRYELEAKKRELNFDLTYEQLRGLTSQVCFYCGLEPKQLIDNYAIPYVYNGIDRQDNSIGYIISNCAPCCKFCNAAKGKMSVTEFIEYCNRVVVYQNSKKLAEMTNSAQASNKL